MADMGICIFQRVNIYYLFVTLAARVEISRRRSCSLARYEFDVARNLILMAGIRHQRESGYPDDEL